MFIILILPAYKWLPPFAADLQIKKIHKTYGVKDQQYLIRNWNMRIVYPPPLHRTMLQSLYLEKSID